MNRAPMAWFASVLVAFIPLCAFGQVFTFELEPVTNSSGDGDPFEPEFDSVTHHTFNLRVTVHDYHWTTAWADVDLTMGTFFQSVLGGDVPPSEGTIQFSPATEYDSYWSAYDGQQVTFAPGSPIEKTPTSLEAEWYGDPEFDYPPTPAELHTLRFTIILPEPIVPATTTTERFPVPIGELEGIHYHSGGSGGAFQFVEFTIYSTCRGDLNLDGTVTLADLEMLLLAYNADDSGDLDGDGDTDIGDLAEFLSLYLDSSAGAPPACCALFEDTDGDGLSGPCDNCPDDHNPDQVDTDGDHSGDACDVCPGFDDRINADSDSVPDGCDNCPDDDNQDQADADDDGVGDVCDNCLDDFNSEQVDTDDDGHGDVCDICPGYDDDADADLDGVPDGCDICWGYDDDVDSDGDGVPDGCDSEQCEAAQFTGPGAERFGRSIWTENGVAIIGDNRGWGLHGVAHVYEFDGVDWVLQATLTASDPSNYAEFGQSVSLSGSYAVVGSPGKDDAGHDSGAVYVFERSGEMWTEQVKLIGSGIGEYDYFGRVVAIHGDRIVAGTSDNEVYVFLYQEGDWLEEASLAAPGMLDAFGAIRNLAIDGELIAVGAPNNDDAAEDAGAVFVFEFDGTSWAQQAQLIPADAGLNDRFGRAVTIDSGLILAGSRSAGGSAYVFEFDGSQWVEGGKLTPSDGAPGFGSAVSLDGDLIAVGAPYDDVVHQNTGSVYLFEHSGGPWTQRAKLTVATPDGGARLGFAVSLGGDSLLAGAPWYGQTGVVYDFRLTGEDCNQDGRPDLCQVLVGSVPDCNENGVPDECDLADGTLHDENGNGVPDECEADCNGNGVWDTWDIEAGTSHDWDENGVPDECDCLGDVSGDGLIDGMDIVHVFINYGTTGGTPYCPGDADGDGNVDLHDLAIVVAMFGADCI